MGVLKNIRSELDCEAVNLLDEYRERLSFEAQRLCGDDRHAADDLVMRTFETYFLKRESYDSAKGPLLPWLKTIMRNLHADAARNKAQSSMVYLSPEEIELISDMRREAARSDEGADWSENELIRKAIDDLPEKVRTCVLLRYYDSLSTVQIAKVLAISSDSVRSRLCYANKILARRLGKKIKKPLIAMLVIAFSVATLFGAWKTFDLLGWQGRVRTDDGNAASGDVCDMAEPETDAETCHEYTDVEFRSSDLKTSEPTKVQTGMTESGKIGLKVEGGGAEMNVKGALRAGAAGVVLGAVTAFAADGTTDPSWGVGSDVTIAAGETVTLTHSTERLHSLTVAGTLITSGWETKVEADSVVVGEGGKITCAGAFLETEMSNRVWIVADDVEVRGSIDVSGCGYRGVGNDVPAQGPGMSKVSGIYVGAAHGGWGGEIGAYVAAMNKHPLPSPCDDPLNPVQPGSGTCANSAAPAVGANGGGVIVIEASGTVSLFGQLVANGGDASSSPCGGGAGGTINVTGKTILGSGSLTAEGGASKGNGGYGGGGCISVAYDKVAQAKLAQPDLTFSALGGYYTHQAAPRRTFEAAAAPGEVGTVHFTDAALLKENFNGSGQIYLDEPKWSPDSLTITGVWASFPQEGFELDVKGDLVIQRRLLYIPGRLDIGGAEALQHGFMLPTALTGVDGSKVTRPHRWRRFPRTTPSRLHVGGNLKLGNGTTLCDLVISAARLTEADAASETPKGGVIRVDGTMTIDSGNALSLVSHMRTGVSPRLSCRNLVVKSGALVNANVLGWLGGVYATAVTPFEDQVLAGFGPGAVRTTSAVYYNKGAAHGGLAQGMTDESYLYDNEKNPHMPGSGASGGTTGYGEVGSFGGGVIYAEVDKVARIAGTLSADGGGAYGNHTGGGSGGAICLKAKQLCIESTASLSAKGGGRSSSGTAGGGGRIAVWRQRDDPETVVRTLDELKAVASAAGGNASAGEGSVCLGTLPSPGLVILLR